MKNIGESLTQEDKIYRIAIMIIGEKRSFENIKNEIENNQFDYVKKMKENNEKEDKENNKEKKNIEEKTNENNESESSCSSRYSNTNSSTGNSSDKEDTDSSNESESSSNEEQLYANILKFPVQTIVLECCDDTLDSYIINSKISDDELGGKYEEGLKKENVKYFYSKNSRKYIHNNNKRHT